MDYTKRMDEPLLLQALSLDTPPSVREMLREIGPGENGFHNFPFEFAEDEWNVYLRRNMEMAEGVGLAPSMVAQTTYWLFAADRPVGVSRLRHSLTDKLRVEGGHIGYCIRPAERGRGYGREILRLTLSVAFGKGIAEVLVTCNEDNTASRRVIEGNGGVLRDRTGIVCRYTITGDTFRRATAHRQTPGRSAPRRTRS